MSDRGARDAAPPVAAWRPASIPRRLAALAYESLLLAALLLLTGFALLLVTPGGAAARGLAVPDPLVRAMWFASMVVVLGTYCVYLWSGGRRTLPMKTWRLRLVCRDGRALDVHRALLRFASAWIGPALASGTYAWLHDRGGGRWAILLLAANFLWAMFDRDRQFLHDRLAGTVTLDDRG